MAGIKALRFLQLGKETTAGTAVAATTIWRGEGTIEDQREPQWPAEDVGIIGGTDRSYIPSVQAAVSMDETPATFEQLPYLLAAGVQGVTTGTQDGTGSGYVYTYALPTTAVNSIATYTIEGGDNQQAEEVSYAFVSELTIAGAAGEAVTMTADWIGREATPTTKTPGLSIPDVEEILFQKAKLYIDDASGTIGTTLVSNSLVGFSLGITTGWHPTYTDGGQLTFTRADLDGESLEVTLEMTWLHDTNAVAEKAAWRAETPRLVRLEIPGSNLATAGTFTTKLLRIDLAGKWESFEALDEQDGNSILTATLRARYNAAAALFGEIVVVNELTALP